MSNAMGTLMQLTSIFTYKITKIRASRALQTATGLLFDKWMQMVTFTKLLLVLAHVCHV